MAQASIELKASQISGNYFDSRPLFVEHRSVLLCAFGSDVQAISIHTGSLVGTFRGHTGLVSCMVNPNLPSPTSNRVVTNRIGAGDSAANVRGRQHAAEVHPEDIVISASLDGAIIVWSLVSTPSPPTP